jgi:pyruvate dehydrogenase E2 component (dihydrolipoamide acetyltransferase)
MAKEVRLPQLGQTMEEGTIVGCMVKVGDEVEKGDCIFEIETDKATLEVESPTGGFVKHIIAQEGVTLLVGDVLLVVGQKDEEVPQSFIDSLKRGVEVESRKEEVASKKPEETAGKVKASPRAKKLAGELGVVLAEISGTGPGGKITEQDVKNATQSQPSGEKEIGTRAKGGVTIPLNKMQRITAERMLKSKREIPCFYLTTKVDVTELVEMRTKLNETNDVKVAYNDFIIRAVALGLEKFPIMTGQLVGDVIELAEAINVGLAMSVAEGLIVPVVKDANKKEIKAIARETNTLIEKAENNKLLLTDLEGGCITISNLGAFGIESFIPIVVPGQCSILGIGRISDDCVPSDNEIKIRKLINITLSVDHKVANGAYAARFLDYVKKLLEDTTTFV